MVANVLESLSADLANAVEAAGKSLVRIEARRRQTATGIVWSADGLIVTAHHVVERDENIRAGLPDGTVVAAQLVGRDPTTDIAVLRVQAEGLAAATWAELDTVQVGQLVLAVGRPDAAPQASLGVVNVLDDAWRTMAGGTVDAYVQTDVTMYPGFSGGALVGANGAFIGMNSSLLARGASVTLPAATLRRVADSLRVNGRVKRGFLGVNAQGVRLPASLAEALGQETGLLLAAIEQGGPAEVAGMMVGDILVALDEQPVRHMDDLMALLSSDRVGKIVPVRVVRGGQVTDSSVTVGERTA
ncbi:MAG: trypsin-like peptidase domain-containing protein [Anaerolineae bacterium]|nr:trypsin-like peptidase domain-containing protein [Anaerolineae bacterium]